MTEKKKIDEQFEKFHGRPRKTYSNFTPAFYLAKEQREEAFAWMQAHDKERHIADGKTFRYAGAIGGAYTWSFTPTSIGVVTGVTCSCGEKLDISDYDNW